MKSLEICQRICQTYHERKDDPDWNWIPESGLVRKPIAITDEDFSKMVRHVACITCDYFFEHQMATQTPQAHITKLQLAQAMVSPVRCPGKDYP
jgi:hypothetical protein